jgi:diphthamide biosynthesis protein 2
MILVLSQIDIFCVVACPENSIFGFSEFMKGVVTPHEILLALNPNMEWKAEIFSDFNRIKEEDTKFNPTEEDL